MLTEMAANIVAEALATALDGGALLIFDRDGTLLAEPRFQAKAFRKPSGGAALANPLHADTDAKASGKPDWYRLVTAKGEAILEGTVNGSDSPLTVSTAEIVQGAEVIVDDYKLTAKRS